MSFQVIYCSGHEPEASHQRLELKSWLCPLQDRRLWEVFLTSLNLFPSLWNGDNSSNSAAVVSLQWHNVYESVLNVQQIIVTESISAVFKFRLLGPLTRLRWVFSTWQKKEEQTAFTEWLLNGRHFRYVSHWIWASLLTSSMTMGWLPNFYTVIFSSVKYI